MELHRPIVFGIPSRDRLHDEGGKGGGIRLRGCHSREGSLEDAIGIGVGAGSPVERGQSVVRKAGPTLVEEAMALAKGLDEGLDVGDIAAHGGGHLGHPLTEDEGLADGESLVGAEGGIDLGGRIAGIVGRVMG